MPIKNGALRIFRVAGVDVYLHWTWLILIYVLYSTTSGIYRDKPGWVVLDIVCYIVMVGIHESVQVIAGRMVGGQVSEMTIAFFSRGSNLQLPQRPWPIIITY